jgi:hypothetical protein
MEPFIVYVAAALALAMLLSTNAPAPQPPTIIIMQSSSDQPRGGCLGLIFGIALFFGLVMLLAPFAS